MEETGYDNYRSHTIGDMFDKAVDNTLNNNDFMNYAEDKKGPKVLIFQKG